VLKWFVVPASHQEQLHHHHLLQLLVPLLEVGLWDVQLQLLLL
jgi:hypothetical protein